MLLQFLDSFLLDVYVLPPCVTHTAVANMSLLNWFQDA
jgi:hypothetical protein